MGRICVVDDDAAIREWLVDALLEEGYEVVSAADGEAALRLLERMDPLPDLILLDLLMPRMDGRALRLRQREHPRLAAIPVVLISAARDLASGAADLHIPEYLAKPLQLECLLDTVARYCDDGDRSAQEERTAR
jgi:two-component system, chemotaxis family, chemotaxis protein CheY